MKENHSVQSLDMDKNQVINKESSSLGWYHWYGDVGFIVEYGSNLDLMRAVSLPYLISYISIFEIKIYKYVNLDQMDKCYTSLTFLHWFWQYWPHKSYISSHHVSKYLSNIWLNKMKWIVLFFYQI